MDQLRKAWAWFVRYHFWVLTIVAIIVVAYCWNSGTSALEQEYAANKSKIEQSFSAISSVSNEPFKPNDEVKEKQQEQIDIQKKAVRSMWQQLYDRQRDNVLKWPENLSQEFRNFVGGLQFGAEIPIDLRNHYNTYVRDHFPNLPKIVGATLAPEGDVGGGRMSMRRGGRGEYGGPGMTMSDGQAATEEEDFIVEWLDQDLIRKQLNSPTTPSSQRIWKTQEDLWVIEALLQIVAATNKAAGADRNSNAAVRTIETLEVGASAARHSRTPNRFEMLQASQAGAGGEFGGGEYGGGEYGGGGPMGERGGGMAGGEYGGGEYGGGEFGEYRGGPGGMMEEGDAELFTNRYIGEDGLPMATPPEATVAFKRLPVRMSLEMDERWLQHLIAECANAPLQVDVQEVRINAGDSGSGGGGGRGMRGYRSSAARDGEAVAPEAEPNIKPVIIQGIIYIFNPPASETAAAGADLAGA